MRGHLTIEKHCLHWTIPSIPQQPLCFCCQHDLSSVAADGHNTAPILPQWKRLSLHGLLTWRLLEGLPELLQQPQPHAAGLQCTEKD